MPKKPPRLPENTSRERKVTEEESLLWQAVMGEIPLPLAGAEPSKETSPRPSPAPDPEQLQNLLQGGMASGTALPKNKARAQHAVIDWRTARKLRQGKMEPEARIDLHGSTQPEAHALLQRFLEDAQREGKRAVLVITGKGATRKDAGVLRAAFPGWIGSAPCSAYVAAFAPAHLRHGGDGAFYVLIRKKK